MVGTDVTELSPVKVSAKAVPEKLHHVAYVTHDAAATVDFYTRVMGMEFASTVLDNRIPSTGDPFPYFHIFFRMADGSTVAFFESLGVPEPAPSSHPAYDIFNHLALDVGTREAVDRWHERLVGEGLDVVGPTDHGIIYSIYFHDPNGVRLELTASLDEDWNNHTALAYKDLETWEAAKARARAEGRDVAEELNRVIDQADKSMTERGVKTGSKLHDA